MLNQSIYKEAVKLALPKFFIILIAAVFLVSKASALTPLADCAVLSTAGETYQLTIDLNLSSVANASYICFDITAENVTLDCQNNFVVADESSAPLNSAGISISADNATITNCISRGWFYGLNANAANSVVNNSNFSNNYYGIYTSASSANNRFYNNYLSGNGGSNIVDNGVSNAWVIGPVAIPGTNIIGGPNLGGNYYDDYPGGYLLTLGIGTSPYIIYNSSGVQQTQDALPLTNNSFLPSCGTLYNTPGVKTLTGNLTCTSGNGITISSGNVVLDCQGFTVSGPGWGYGIYATNANNVTVKNCNVNGWENGIYYSSIANSYVDNVNATNNSRGIYFYNTTNSNVTNSNSSYNSAEGFSARFSNEISYINDDANGNDGFAGFYLLAVPNAKLIDVRAANNGWSQPFGGGYGIQLQWADGAVVTNAIINNQRTALCNYDSQNVSINGGNFTATEGMGIINGESCYFDDPDINSRYAWMNFPTNFTVQNAYIFSPNVGIYNSHERGSLVAINNTLVSNQTQPQPGCNGECIYGGIVDRGITGLIIDGNTIMGFGDGIEVVGNSSVTNNIINVNGQALSACNLTFAANNTQNGNEVFWANQNTNITGGTYAEIDLCKAPNSLITGVTVTNGGGIFIIYSPSVIVSNNIINNVFYGISLLQSNSGVISSNTVTNVAAGIVLWGSPFTNITNNTVSNATFSAFPTAALGASDGVQNLTITYNTFSDSDNGIILVGQDINGPTTNNLIAFNTLINNANYGIMLGDSPTSLANNTNILNNTICNNTLGGVNSVYSTNTVLANNTFCVELLAPQNGTIFKGSMNFSANATNILFAGTNCTLLVNGTNYGSYLANAPADSPIYNSVSVSPDGLYFWTVQCIDSNGNNGIAPARAFIVDSTAPIITLNAPVDGTTLSVSGSTNVYFKYTASDAFSPEMSCTLYIDNPSTSFTNNLVSNGVTVVKKILLGLGSHNWYVSCTDALGNSGTSASQTITLLASSPTSGPVGGGGPPVPQNHQTTPTETQPQPEFETQTIEGGVPLDQAPAENKKLILGNITNVTIPQSTPTQELKKTIQSEPTFPIQLVAVVASAILVWLTAAAYLISRRFRKG